MPGAPKPKTPPEGGVFYGSSGGAAGSAAAPPSQAFRSCHPGTGNTGFACAAFSGSTTFG